MIVLFAHVRTGKWASVMPLKLAEVLGLTEPVRAIPIVEPDVRHTRRAGRAAPRAAYAAVAALVSEARQLAVDSQR